MATTYGTPVRFRMHPVHAYRRRYYALCGAETVGSKDSTKVTCKTCRKLLRVRRHRVRLANLFRKHGLPPLGFKLPADGVVSVPMKDGPPMTYMTFKGMRLLWKALKPKSKRQPMPGRTNVG